MPDLVGHFFFQSQKRTQLIAIRSLDSDFAKDVSLIGFTDETLKAMEHEMVTKEEIECRLAGAKIETRKATQINDAKILVEAGKLSIDDAITLLHVPENIARSWKTKKD